MYIDGDTAVRLAKEQIETTLRVAAQQREARAGEPVGSVEARLRKVFAWLGHWRIN